MSTKAQTRHRNPKAARVSSRNAPTNSAGSHQNAAPPQIQIKTAEIADTAAIPFNNMIFLPAYTYSSIILRFSV